VDVVWYLSIKVLYGEYYVLMGSSLEESLYFMVFYYMSAWLSGQI